MVDEPDGRHAYEETFTAPAAGGIEQALTAASGECIRSVTEPAGSGSCEVHLDHGSTGGST